MKKYITALILIFLPAFSHANWNNAVNTLNSFFKALNKNNAVQAGKLCEYQMKDYFNAKIKPFIKKAEKNPAKYLTRYFIFKKEKTGSIYAFSVFMHVYNQKAVRFAVFFVEKIRGRFKITRINRINPLRVVTPG